MSLAVQITKITPLVPDRVFIQWDLLDPAEHGVYSFILERAGSSEGPWETCLTSANTYYYIDDFRNQPGYNPTETVNTYSTQRELYYRVKVIPPSGDQNMVVSAPHSLWPEIAYMASGLRRRLQYDEDIIFRRVNGVRLVLLKRRRWGERCQTCYDPETKATTWEACPECYGTTFKGGYWNPVVVWGRIAPPHNVSPQFTGHGDVAEGIRHQVTILDVPLLQDRDLIIETELNHRHIVERKTQTELRRRTVHQQLVTELLDRGSVEYAIPVDLRVIPPLL